MIAHYFFGGSYMNGKILAVALLSLSTSVFAAKFTPIKTMKDTKLEKLSEIFARATKNEEIFGDCGGLNAFKVTKKADEANLNSMKQMHIAYGGLFAGNDETTYRENPKNTTGITRTLLSHDSDMDYLDEEQKVIYDKANVDVSKAIYSATNALKDKTKEIYSAFHSDEDGTWAILSIYDTKNQEVLMMQVGGCGT